MKKRIQHVLYSPDVCTEHRSTLSIKYRATNSWMCCLLSTISELHMKKCHCDWNLAALKQKGLDLVFAAIKTMQSKFITILNIHVLSLCSTLVCTEIGNVVKTLI